MPRRQKLYHYIYKTTCLVTGKFYVGMHSTDIMDDVYLGSGKILGYSIAKHGRENHRREIIEMCPSREALKLREKEIVNEQLLADPLNINLKYGGEGGWDHLCNDPEYVTKRNAALARGRDTQRKCEVLKSQRREIGRNRFIALHKEGRVGNRFSGKKHSAHTKAAIGKKTSLSQGGSGNSQYGTCWMNLDGKAVKIKKDAVPLYLEQGYKQGRK